MNKKGFTLIEVLSTIAIMTIIATMVSINITKIFDNNKTSKEEANKEIITNAACTYIELNKNQELKKECLTVGCDITTDTLINEGLLDNENINKPIIIHIKKENNEKKCIIKEGN